MEYNLLMDCPCGSKNPFSACCEPYITGKASAPTAEALMRARYSSYATGAVDFIGTSQAPEGLDSFDREASLKWSKEATWKGLEVIATKNGGASDTTGNVSFIAKYFQDGEDREHHEIGIFRKDDGKWLFVEGKAPVPDTHKNDGPTIGRNDPCHCGSGKKFKKCHG